MTVIIIVCYFRYTTSCWIIDTAFVCASSNFEETFVTPLWVPRVNQQPIRDSVFFAPSDQLYGMSSQERSIFRSNVNPLRHDIILVQNDIIIIKKKITYNEHDCWLVYLIYNWGNHHIHQTILQLVRKSLRLFGWYRKLGSSSHVLLSCFNRFNTFNSM